MARVRFPDGALLAHSFKNEEQEILALLEDSERKGSVVQHLSKKSSGGGMRICGLVVEYIVAIDVTRVRFPADAFLRESTARHVNVCSAVGEQRPESSRRRTGSVIV